MYSLALLAAAAAAFRPGALALTLAKPDGVPEDARGVAGVQEACLAAAGLPDCPRRGGADSCFDSDLLAEDMGELGFGAGGCARAVRMGTGARGSPASDALARARQGRPERDPPEPGQVPPASVFHTKPVIWVHIHKSMGTFICSLAKMSGENIVRPSMNGNWVPYDTPDPMGSRKGMPNGEKGADCSKRLEFFEWSNATWGQIEHPMEDWNLCHDHFNYGILLRDPIELAISKANFEKYFLDEVIGSLSCMAERERDNVTELETPTKLFSDQRRRRARNAFAPSDTCGDRAARIKNDWKLWWFFDNFLVRMLGGYSVWSLPAGGVTEEHAQIAIQRLSKFEVVMFPEDFENTEYLETAIGWRSEHYEKAPKRSSDHTIQLTDEQNRQARLTNRFDYMVYDHFRRFPMQERIKKLQ